MFIKRVVLCCAALLTAGAAVAIAQNRTAIGDTDPMMQLVAEVRGLRLAVEESGRVQSQTQALGVQLAAQQARVSQARASLDAALKDAYELNARLTDLSMQLARAKEDVAAETNPRDRENMNQHARQLKLLLDTLTVQEQTAKVRHAELVGALQYEDSRWTELIARLEQLTKK